MERIGSGAWLGTPAAHVKHAVFSVQGLEVSETEAARMRRDELKHVMLKQKLYLVLDLDHTMLNSARFIEVHPEEEAHLAACYTKGTVPSLFSASG